MKSLLYRRMLTLAALVCAPFTAGLAESQPARMRLLDECPPHVRGCVTMDWALTRKTSPDPMVRRHGVVVSRVNTYALPLRPYARIYILRVTGSLSSEAAQAYLLDYRESVPGFMPCSSEYTGTVAVVGFSAKKNPIVLTSGGEFEITDGSTEVGCDDCLAVISKQARTMRLVKTPHWEQSYDVFSFHPSGRIFIAGPAGCTEYFDDRRFGAVDRRYCDGPWSLQRQFTERAHRFSDAGLAAQERFSDLSHEQKKLFWQFSAHLESSDLPFDIVYYRGVCS